VGIDLLLDLDLYNLPFETTIIAEPSTCHSIDKCYSI
jgi:hypothetical protein